jgi:protein gp37
MSDLFHKDIPDGFIARVFATMAATPQHTYQILTKRHARMRALLSKPSFPELVTTWAWRDRGGTPTIGHRGLFSLPLPNVWLGVSVENQHWADIRIPALLKTPAAVRFLSCEPLLGPVDLTMVDWDGATGLCVLEKAPYGIDWVIAGGESGTGARPMHPDWVRTLRDQCVAGAVPFLFKQWGAWGPTNQVGAGVGEPNEVCLPDSSVRQLRPDFQEGRWFRRVGKKAAGRELDGRTWDEYPDVPP